MVTDRQKAADIDTLLKGRLKYRLLLWIIPRRWHQALKTQAWDHAHEKSAARRRILGD